MSLISLRPTTPADLDFVLTLEGDPNNRPFIGQWSRQEHVDAIVRSDREHWIIVGPDGAAVGYLIAFNLEALGAGAYIKRIVAAEKSRGTGRAAVQAFIRHAFDDLMVDRVWLRVYADNLRAQHAYRAAGLEVVEFSAAERAALHDAVGAFSDRSIMMMLKRA